MLNTASGYASTLTDVSNFVYSGAPSEYLDPSASVTIDAAGNIIIPSGFNVVFEVAKTASGYASIPIVMSIIDSQVGAAQTALGLTTDTAGDLFGTTFAGGAFGYGTVFEVAKTASGYATTPTTLVNFGFSRDTAPYAALTVDAAGDLFGELTDGGFGVYTGDYSSIYEIVNTTNGYSSTPITLVTFNGTDGDDPNGGLLLDAAGDLIGTTPTAVFEVVKTATGYANTPITLASGLSDPDSGVVADAAGNLFGTTYYGGANNQGTVFEIPKTASGYGTPITLVSFYSPNTGENPSGLLVNAAGDFFGTTNSGGATGEGTVWELDHTGFQVSCYLRGTGIGTPLGDVPVECLATGDLVLTASGERQPIVWIDQCRLDARRLPRPADVWPVRVRAGAFGADLPRRDLLLSPDHAVFVDGVLIPIRCLINATTVAQEPMDAITYYHLELPAHDVILAEGLPAESYLDTGNRTAFAAGHPAHLPPALDRTAEIVWQERGCAPLVQSGPVIEAVRARLAGQAASLGTHCAPEAVLQINAAGLAALSVPPHVQLVRLASLAVTPPGDRRLLGVAIDSLALDGDSLALDDARLARGFHPTEGTSPQRWRWTNGEAALELAPSAAVRRLEVKVVSVSSAAAA